MPKKKAETSGLVGELHLAMGAKVMLTIKVSDGLVNGAMRRVVAIITTDNQVTLVLVKFEHDNIGVKAISNSHYWEEHCNGIPISRYEAVFNIGRNKAVEVSRRQLPIVLVWAATIHKVGLTRPDCCTHEGKGIQCRSRICSFQSNEVSGWSVHQKF